MGDHRLVRRNDKVRVVRRPANLELTRRNDEEKPGEALRSAVLACLVLGHPIPKIAQQFGLSERVVEKWQEAFDITNPVKRRDSLSEQLLAFVEQEIAALMTISYTTMDEDWIKAQGAQELSIFMAAKQDRLMKILEAFSRAQQSRQQLQGEVVREGEDDE